MTASTRLPTGVDTVSWEEDAEGSAVCLLDQSVLPHQICYLHLRSEAEVAAAIRSLKVRGAPAIGVAAAFGMVLAFARLWHARSADLTPLEARAALTAAADLLRAARPTAVNLPWAVQRMLRCAEAALAAGRPLSELPGLLQREAQAIADEDAAACLAMGRYGGELIPD